MKPIKLAMWSLLAALGAVVIGGAVQASENLTARELLRECQTRAPGEAVPAIGMRSCASYFGHLNDIHSALHSASFVHPQFGVRKSLYCAPTLRSAEVAQIFATYAQTHPEKLHLTARAVWLDAMIENFPCAE